MVEKKPVRTKKEIKSMISKLNKLYNDLDKKLDLVDWYVVDLQKQLNMIDSDDQQVKNWLKGKKSKLDTIF